MFVRLLLLFTLVPLAELYILVKLGEVIGVAATIGIVVVTGVLGAWLTRLQGLRVLRDVRQRLAVGELPTDPLIDGLMILIAGAVLLTPGLITDACGFLLLVPPCRAALRRALVAGWKRKFKDGAPVTIDARWSREE